MLAAIVSHAGSRKVQRVARTDDDSWEITESVGATALGVAAALVSDVFQQWMGGTPSQMAAQAGVLFSNADNPGSPQVQAILASLPSFGL